MILLVNLLSFLYLPPPLPSVVLLFSIFLAVFSLPPLLHPFHHLPLSFSMVTVVNYLPLLCLFFVVLLFLLFLVFFSFFFFLVALIPSSPSFLFGPLGSPSSSFSSSSFGSSSSYSSSSSSPNKEPISHHFLSLA